METEEKTNEEEWGDWVDESEVEKQIICNIVKEEEAQLKHNKVRDIMREVYVNNNSDVRNKAIELINLSVLNSDGTTTIKPEYTLVMGKDIENLDVPDVEFAIDDFLLQSGIQCIAGESATRKSFTSIYMAECIANGLPFLNKYVTKKQKVLYLCEENSWSILKTYICAVQNWLKTNKTSEVVYTCYDSFGLDYANRSADTQKLVKAAIDAKADIMFFDSMKRFIAFEENDADKVNIWYTYTLKEVVKFLNISIILIHHTKKKNVNNRYGNDSEKKDMLRGSSDFFNIFDNVLLFERDVKRDTVDISQLKLRGRMEFNKKRIVCHADTVARMIGWEEIKIADKPEMSMAEILSDTLLQIIVENNLTNFRTTDLKVLLTENKVKFSANGYNDAKDLLISMNVINLADGSKATSGKYKVNTNSQRYIDKLIELHQEVTQDGTRKHDRDSKLITD